MAWQGRRIIAQDHSAVHLMDEIEQEFDVARPTNADPVLGIKRHTPDIMRQIIACELINAKSLGHDERLFFLLLSGKKQAEA